MKTEYKVVPISLWEMEDYQEHMTQQGWEPYGYEPLPVPSVVNLKREIKGPEGW